MAEEKKSDMVTVSDLIARVEAKAVSLSSSQLTRYTIIGVIALFTLPLIATLFNLPDFLQAVVCAPSALALFLMILGYSARARADRPDSPRLKDRFSFAQRLKIAGFSGLSVLALLFLAGRYIPYAFGGVIVLTLALYLYQFLLRTPEEIAWDEAGRVDPRDAASVTRSEANRNGGSRLGGITRIFRRRR